MRDRGRCPGEYVCSCSFPGETVYYLWVGSATGLRLCPCSGKSAAFTLDFGRDTVLVVSSIDKVECCLALGEARSKILQVGQVATQGLGQAAKVGHHFCNNFDVGMLAALSSNGVSKLASSLPAAFDALLDPLVAELCLCLALGVSSRGCRAQLYIPAGRRRQS